MIYDRLAARPCLLALSAVFCLAWQSPHTAHAQSAMTDGDAAAPQIIFKHEVEQKKQAEERRKKAAERKRQVEKRKRAAEAQRAATAERKAETERRRATQQKARQERAERQKAEQDRTAERRAQQAERARKKANAAAAARATQERRLRTEANAGGTAKVSRKAAKPKVIVGNFEGAESGRTMIVPDNVTPKQRERLRRAEERRRQKARAERKKLLGAAVAGAVVGAVVPQLGGTLALDEGDRVVIERQGRYYVRKDEGAILRNTYRDVRYEELPNGFVQETALRPDGTAIISLRDPAGYLIRRVKVSPRGAETVLFDSRRRHANHRQALPALPPLASAPPPSNYIVPAGISDRDQLRDTFRYGPYQALPRRFSLQEIQEHEQVRSLVPRVDLDTVTFDTGSAFLSISQVQLLGDLAGGMLDVIAFDPEAVFLVEGHTDAVGSELYNLLLSDRRAEAVARILVEAYSVPPENLVTQGYGEQFLKIPTQAAERQNRRATVRNISDLLDRGQV